MPRPEPALRIDLGRARAFWHRRQGLAEPVKGTLEEVVASTGWLRTLGGTDVYIAARARVPGMRRRDLDEAVEQSRLQVVPAVRGCIYVVPRAEVPLVLRVAEELSSKRTEREHEKAGIVEEEVAGVAEAVVAALRKGPLSTDALRKALPPGVIRSLGEKGKKIGISSTLPPAVRRLEFEGKVERTLEGGRLDSERYAWRLTRKNPFTGAKLPSDPIDRYARVAEAFFRSAAPATLKDFAAWSGFSQKDARAAAERIGLVPIAVEGYADEAFVFEPDLPELREAARPAASISMLSFEDNYLVLHGGPGLVTDPKHHEYPIKVWGQTKGTTLGDAKHISMRSLFDGDQLVGLWELDPDKGKVVFGTFEPTSPARKKVIAALADEMGKFLIEELGHGRSFTLDTEDAMRERAAEVKRL